MVQHSILGRNLLSRPHLSKLSGFLSAAYILMASTPSAASITNEEFAEYLASEKDVKVGQAMMSYASHVTLCAQVLSKHIQSFSSKVAAVDALDSSALKAIVNESDTWHRSYKVECPKNVYEFSVPRNFQSKLAFVQKFIDALVPIAPQIDRTISDASYFFDQVMVAASKKQLDQYDSNTDEIRRAFINNQKLMIQWNEIAADASIAESIPHGALTIGVGSSKLSLVLEELRFAHNSAPKLSQKKIANIISVLREGAADVDFGVRTVRKKVQEILPYQQSINSAINDYSASQEFLETVAKLESNGLALVSQSSEINDWIENNVSISRPLDLDENYEVIEAQMYIQLNIFGELVVEFNQRLVNFQQAVRKGLM